MDLLHFRGDILGRVHLHIIIDRSGSGGDGLMILEFMLTNHVCHELLPYLPIVSILFVTIYNNYAE